MLGFLSAIFGPHRAVTIYAFLQTRGLAVVAGVGLVAIVAGLLFLNDSGEHEHEAFMIVPVLTATPINGDIKYGVTASVRLPDGSAASINADDAVLAGTVGTTACIEKRVYVDSGEPRYRFKFPRYCETQ